MCVCACVCEHTRAARGPSVSQGIATARVAMATRGAAELKAATAAGPPPPPQPTLRRADSLCLARSPPAPPPPPASSSPLIPPSSFSSFLRLPAFVAAPPTRPQQVRGTRGWAPLGALKVSLETNLLKSRLEQELLFLTWTPDPWLTGPLAAAAGGHPLTLSQDRTGRSRAAHRVPLPP